MATRYIQRKDIYGTETIEEVDVNTAVERRNFADSIRELNMSDTSAIYYSSQRACKHWSE
jgi:hypothetical protein